MKIFITGIAGFLGSHLADELISKGHDVVGCDNFIGGYRDNIPEKATFYQADCTELGDMRRAIDDDVDIVYHCAATAYEGLSVFSPSLITKHISLATATVLSASIDKKVKRFVYLSSMARYGNQKTPFTEDMTPMPQDPYGIAKVAGEELVKNLCETHGMDYVIAVPHNIIGTRQKYDDPFRNVASIMLNLMLQGRQPIIYGDGEQVRCFSFVSDCISCLVKMGFQDDVLGEVINIGPDEEFISINELSEIIASILKFDLVPLRYPDRPKEVKKAVCSSNKARKLLGYQTKVGLIDGLNEMIEWIRARGTKKFKYHLPLEIVNDKTPVTWNEEVF